MRKTFIDLYFSIFQISFDKSIGHSDEVYLCIIGDSDPYKSLILNFRDLKMFRNVKPSFQYKVKTSNKNLPFEKLV